MDFQPILDAAMPCWNCNRPNPIHVLVGVRFSKCKCGALFPSYTNSEFRKDSHAIGLPERERIILEQ